MEIRREFPIARDEKGVRVDALPPHQIQALRDGARPASGELLGLDVFQNGKWVNYCKADLDGDIEQCLAMVTLEPKRYRLIWWY
jgi:hypothetical protein